MIVLKLKAEYLISVVLVLVFLGGCTQTSNVNNNSEQKAIVSDKIENPFVPDSFNVPDSFVNEFFILVPLSLKYTRQDYAAIISSTEHLQSVFGKHTEWTAGLTFDHNAEEIAVHEQLFSERKAFAYSVFKKDRSAIIGCVYINPSYKKGYDAKVIMWVTQESFNNGLDSLLMKSVTEWLIEDWPFLSVAFPGREISWDDWGNIEEKSVQPDE